MKKLNNINGSEMVYQDPVIKEMEVNYVLKQRVIPLYDEVTRESVFKCLYWIDKLVALDKIKGTKEPIKIQIDSYGGYVYHGLSLISRIKSLIAEGYEVIGICAGVAMSMGSAILMACSTRKMYKYGTILIHQVSSGAMGEVQTLKEELEESQRLWKLLQDLIIQDTNITQVQLDDITARKFDWILNSEQVLALNVIDQIL